MIGYKIAIGVSEEHGFFPVMVELEIPEDATVVKPLIGVPLFVENDVDVFTKYRTNTCKVIKVYPLDNKSYDDWNGNAFSIYELANWYTDIQTVYKVGSTISVKYVDEDIEHDCGNGIHFFKSADDAERFYNSDISEWAYDIVSKLNGTVVVYGESGVLCLCRHRIKKHCLSFE
jgi:hypothetical protein